MKKFHGLFFGFAVLLMAAMFFVGGCDDGSGSNNNNSGNNNSGNNNSGDNNNGDNNGGNNNGGNNNGGNNNGGNNNGGNNNGGNNNGGGTAPSAPTGVSATAQSSSSISVTWNAVSGATSYKVYYATSSSGTYSLDDTTTSTSFTSTGWGAGETGYFRVTAVNSAGESSNSSTVSATTQASNSGGNNNGGNNNGGNNNGGNNNGGNNNGGGTAPSVPTGLTATAQSSSSITVSWNSVSGATGYYVYRSSSASGSYSRLDDTSSTSYTNTGLSASTAYYYKVAAYNSSGTSSQSSYTSATTNAPTVNKPNAPYGITTLSAQATSTSLKIEWDASSGATGYKLYYATSSSGPFVVLYTSTSASTRTYTHTGLSPNTTYYYKVTATNSAGESEFSTSIMALLT